MGGGHAGGCQRSVEWRGKGHGGEGRNGEPRPAGEEARREEMLGGVGCWKEVEEEEEMEEEG